VLTPRLGTHVGPQPVLNSTESRPGRRYYIPPQVLRSAQTGRGYVDVCRPDTDTWVRLGPREGALLLGLSGVACDELQDRFGDRFTPGELSAALHRFETLGLLMDRDAGADGAVAAAVTTPGPTSWGSIAAPAIPAVLIAVAIASLPLVARHVSWQGVLQGKPSLLGVAGLSLMAALLHEAGHAAAGIVLGHGRLHCQLRWGWLTVLPVLRLRLAGFWGLSRVRRMAVAGAGSLAHLVLAAVNVHVWLMLLALTGAGPTVLLWYAALNVVLAGVNVLPLYPLDGYWLLVLLLDRPWLWRESRVYRALSSIALGAIVALGAAGLAVRVFGGR